MFSDGYGLGIIGIALSKAPAASQSSSLWMGLLGGASLFGLFAGALLKGPVADRFGRWPIFACNMVLLAGLASCRVGLTRRRKSWHCACASAFCSAPTMWSIS